MAAGSIVIDLLMRTGAFETDTKRAEARLKALKTQVTGLASDFGLSAVGIGAATTALLAWTKATVDGIDALNDFADATGTSVENASALEDVALRTGASLETAQAVLVKFNNVLKDVKPGTDAANILKTIGLNAEELKRIDPAEALRQTAVALSQFADDGAKARAIQELFGKSVKEAAPFLKDLADQTRLVATVTAKEAKAAEDFNKAIFNLQKGITDLSRTALTPLISQMAAVANGFKEGERAGKSYFQNLTTEYWKWVKSTYGMGRQGPVGGLVTEEKPSIAGQGHRPANEGGGGVDWELFEANRKKASEAAEEAIRKAKEASRAAERAIEKEKQQAWEIEKTNITAIFEAESKLRQEGAAVYEATRTPLEQLNAEQERLAKLLELGVISWDTYGRAVMAVSEAYDKTLADNKKILTSTEAVQGILQSNFESFFTNIQNGALKAKDAFKQMAQSILAQLLRLVAQKAILAAFGLNIGGPAGGVKAAHGAAFQHGRKLQAFASGGVISQPTLFPMAHGSGLAGEAGPEGVFPLRRSASGDLGVEGTQPIVNVQITNMAPGTTASARQNGNDVQVLIEQTKQSIMGDIRAGGNRMASTFERTYGVGRVAGAR